MPEIIITTRARARSRRPRSDRERIDAAQVESETASHLLVERIGWALSDADTLEHEDDTDAVPARPPERLA